MTRLVLLFVLVAFSSVASAGTQCTSTIKGVSLQPNGSVYLEKFGNWNWLSVCSVNTDANRTNPESCKAIYSLLLSAQISGRKVSFWFNNGRDCTACSQESWDWMRDWYFGPLIHNS